MDELPGRSSCIGHHQKTGFYLDQRDNRRAVATYARGRSVLDLFCYSGGFALNALRHGGASSVRGFDTSESAITSARRHAEANGLEGQVQFSEGDAFEVLDALRASESRFGLVVCDPPKFVPHAQAIAEGLRGYQRLNRAALDVLEPDGVLVTCSCSGLVDRGVFAEVLAHVAERSARLIQFLEQRGQAADHPVSASCLESDYLKCVICRVG